MDLHIDDRPEMAEQWGCLPERTPQGWRRRLDVEEATGNATYQKRQGKIAVMITARVEADGKRWLHVSASTERKVPTYEQLCEVKRVFIGDERQAVQVFAKKSEHINLHPYVLHLWCCLDVDPLPDFRHNGAI